jgi:allantoin racemase
MNRRETHELFTIADRRARAYDNRMRILYISPTGHSVYANEMAQIMERARSPDTIIDFVALPDDRPRHLEYHSYEGLVVADLVRIVYARASAYDAIISGGYYDVALRELREVSQGAIVVGPCQATTAIACTLGNTFSVLVGKQKWIDKMTANVRSYGHGDRMVSMRAAGLAVHDFQTVPDAAERLLSLGKSCVKDDGAEVLILGCTVEYGFSEYMQEALGVPVLEAIPAALKYAEMLADSASRFGWYPSRKGGSEAPPENEIKDWGLFEEELPIGIELTIGNG